MATISYLEALRHVQSLSPADQKRLLAEVAQQLETVPEQTTSILQLQGLGKEIWRDVDGQEYVEQERASWHG
jgi:hypothetical protein